MIDGNLLSETVQRADVVFERFRFIESPDGQSQLDLRHGPEERVDRINDFFRLRIRIVGYAAQAGVERDAANG